MPLLVEEARKLSEDDMVRGVIEEFIFNEPLYAILPYVGTQGKAYTYNREASLATGDWLNPNEIVKEGASTFSEHTTNLRILIGDVDVDKFIDGTMSDHNNQKAIQIAAKAKGMSNQFRNVLINGDASQKQFDGIQRLVDSKRVIAANSTKLSLSMLDELKDAVTLGADMFMMRPELIRAYKQLMRTFGGNTGLMMQLDNFGKQVLSFEGIPILANEYLTPYAASKDGKGLCSDIFAVRCNEADGLHGLFASGHSAGFAIEDIGTVQNKDATRTRIKMYTGLALKATHSLAKIAGVLHA